MHNVVGSALWAQLGAECTGLGAVPMFHITGFLTGVLVPAYVGSTTVHPRAFSRACTASSGIAFGNFSSLVSLGTCAPLGASSAFFASQSL
jgi:hypothetical protein